MRISSFLSPRLSSQFSRYQGVNINVETLFLQILKNSERKGTSLYSNKEKDENFMKLTLYLKEFYENNCH